jgi:hypothetical protein
VKRGVEAESQGKRVEQRKKRRKRIEERHIHEENTYCCSRDSLPCLGGGGSGEGVQVLGRAWTKPEILAALKRGTEQADLHGLERQSTGTVHRR